MNKKIQIIICVAIEIFCIISLFFMTCKCRNTFENHSTINYALLYYQTDCILNHKDFKVTYDDKEKWEETFWRLWDWGYEHILPEEKFEIIKPYIH